MIERFATVRVKELKPLEDNTLPDFFIKSRRAKMQGVVDSPIYLNYNHLWLVKHITSKLVRGVSVGYYGVYHEDELEVIARPPDRKYEPRLRGEPQEVVTYDDNAEFDYNSWDDVPDED